MQDKTKRIIIITIFIIAILVRAINWPNIIQGLNCDEAMSAINAKSIAETGCDIYGTRFPVCFEAWLIGNQSGLLIYLIAITVKIFGYSNFAIRLPMLIISILSIFIFDKLIQQVFKDNFKIRVIMLALLAINPWHIMQSVWSLDCNLFPHFLLFSIYMLLQGVNQDKKIVIYLSMILFGITMYTYGIALYALPIFLAITMIFLLYKRKTRLFDVIICFIIFMLISLPILLMAIIQVFDLSTINIGIITIPKFEYFARTNDMLIFSDNFGKTLCNNIISFAKMLFINTDGCVWNAFPAVGTIYIGSILFVFMLILELFDKEKKRLAINNQMSFIVIWLIVASLIGILINSVNINRINILWYPLIIVIGYGIYLFLDVLKWNKIVIIILAMLYIIYFSFFVVLLYNNNINNSYTWSNGLIESIKCINEQYNDTIYVSEEVINSDKEEILIISAIYYDFSKGFLDKNILFDYYIDGSNDKFRNWLEHSSNLKIIFDNEIPDNAKYIIMENINEIDEKYTEMRFNKYTILVK